MHGERTGAGETALSFIAWSVLALAYRARNRGLPDTELAGKIGAAAGSLLPTTGRWATPTIVCAGGWYVVQRLSRNGEDAGEDATDDHDNDDHDDGEYYSDGVEVVRLD